MYMRALATQQFLAGDRLAGLARRSAADSIRGSQTSLTAWVILGVRHCSVRDLWHTCRPSTNGGTPTRCRGWPSMTESSGRDADTTRSSARSPATYSSVRPRDHRKIDSGSVRRQTRILEQRTVSRSRLPVHRQKTTMRLWQARRAAEDVPVHPGNHTVAGPASALSAVPILSQGAFRSRRSIDAEGCPHRFARRMAGTLSASHSHPARNALRG